MALLLFNLSLSNIVLSIIALFATVVITMAPLLPLGNVKRLFIT